MRGGREAETVGEREKVVAFGLRLAAPVMLALLAALACCLILGAPARSDEAPPRQVSYAPSLVASAGDARYLLAAKTDLFLGSLDAPSRAAAQAALKTPGATLEEAALWPAVMAGALQVRHQSGDLGETLWFNPVFDQGLLVRWKRQASAWTVTDAWWVTGADVRKDQAGRPVPIGELAPEWRPAEMARLAAQVFRTSAAADWRAPGKASLRDREALRRARAAAIALAAFKSAKGYGRAPWLAREIIATARADSPGAGAELAKVLDRLDPNVRTSVRAVSAYHQGGGRWTLVLQSPDAPGLAWFVHFDRTGSAPAEVKGVDVVDYAALGRPS